MGKVGIYEYPETNIEECLRVARVLVKDFSGKANDVNAFATAIGHKSTNSGTFLNKIADVRKFNLMDKREYRATNLAQIIIDPKNDNEKNSAIKEMIFTIPLFKSLFDRLKTKSPTVEQVKIQLIDLTSERDKSSKEAEVIRKIYIDAMTYIKDTTDKQISSQERQDNFMENPTTALPPGNEDIMIFRAGKTNLTFPKDDAHIDILISVLETMKISKKKN